MGNNASGTLRVFDRSTGGEVLVYTPTFKTQLESGHRSGQWYVRPADVVGGAPCSVPFSSAREAIDAIAGETWQLRVLAPEMGRPPLSTERPKLRIYWNPPEEHDETQVLSRPAVVDVEPLPILLQDRKYVEHLEALEARGLISPETCLRLAEEWQLQNADLGDRDSE